MPIVYDQLNRTVNIPEFPKRIISLVPSQTELLFYLGVGDRLKGITKFCNHPSGDVAQVAKIGGPKQLNLQVIHNLGPDLIIANKEENEQSQIEELAKHCPVWISDIANLPDALRMIKAVGQITGTDDKADDLNRLILQQFAALNKSTAALRTAYFIWRKPYMVAGAGTFIDDMLQRCGLQNVFTATRYSIVTNDELIAANPQVVLLSSELYPFAEKHIEEFEALLPNARILLADGEMFSWYGNRLLYAPGYFNGLLENLKAM